MDVKTTIVLKIYNPSIKIKLFLFLPQYNNLHQSVNCSISMNNKTYKFVNYKLIEIMLLLQT